jgi:hypothetical protein
MCLLDYVTIKSSMYHHVFIILCKLLSRRDTTASLLSSVTIKPSIYITMFLLYSVSIEPKKYHCVFIEQCDY